MTRYRDELWLREQYYDEGRIQREIAEGCGVSTRTIRKWMRHHGIETREIAGENHGLYGEERDEEVKERISQVLEGREFDEASRREMSESHTGLSIPQEVRNRISRSLKGITRSTETRQRMSESRRGERNHMYRDGESGSYGPGWTAAKQAVHERDADCRACGASSDEAQLEVHHIVPMSRFRQADVPIADAHDLSNLVLLCRPCHIRAEYGDLSFESGVDDPLDDGTR